MKLQVNSYKFEDLPKLLGQVSLIAKRYGLTKCRMIIGQTYEIDGKVIIELT